MAITFTPPYRKKRLLFWSISGFIILLLILILLIAFPYESFLSSEPVAVTPIPDLDVNFDVLDSERVKSLDLFTPPPPETNPGRMEPFIPY